MADKPEKPAASAPRATVPTKPSDRVIDLQAAVNSLVMAVLAARVALDRETAEIARLYQEHDILRQFTPPHFGLNEVTLRLPYAALDVEPSKVESLRSLVPGQVPHMLVQINAELLAKMPAHAVATVELKLTEEQLQMLLPQDS